jgi:hypothetical protein
LPIGDKTNRQFAVNRSIHSFAQLIVKPLVDFGDLANPAIAFSVFQMKYLVVRPVKVIRNVRYLLIEPL